MSDEPAQALPMSAQFGASSKIAGYLIEEKIGQGGMAVVFRARHERLDRTVALKLLLPVLAEDDAFRQRFIRECRAAAALDDPHILPVYDAGAASGGLFMAMRFVRGGDVRSLLDRTGPLPADRAVGIVSQVASALDTAHAAGVVHRDVKPANMLLDGDATGDRPDHVYLADFGLSKLSLPSIGITNPGTFLGTLEYVAPEQIEGKPADGRTDQYALACSAFELLTGSTPFRRDEQQVAIAIMHAQLSEPPPQLSSRRPDLPDAADHVFARALAKSPADRYRTCREFADALSAALGLIPSGTPPGRRLGAAGQMPDRYLSAALEERVPGLVLSQQAIQGSYFYQETWTDGLEPPPLVNMSGVIESPYRGLRVFGEQDASLFFGREQAVDQLLEQMSRRLDGTGLLVVSGAPGVGKSSVVRAGVLPRLRRVGLGATREAMSWPCLVLTPGSRPLEELAVGVAAAAGADAAGVLRGLAADPRSFALIARQVAVAGSGTAPPAGGPGEQRVLLVVDQAERLFTLSDSEDERLAFLTALHAAATSSAGRRPPALVVLVVRSDFEMQLAGYPFLVPAVQDRYLLIGMTEQELRIAITGPAAVAGSSVDAALVQVLLEEARARRGPRGMGSGRAIGAGVLPLLSHALDQAWRSRSGQVLTLADYERTGGIEGAVVGSAQRAYYRLTPARQAVARQVFTRLVATSADGVETSDRATLAELTGGSDPARASEVQAVLEAFVAERLLTLAADSVEISHEALISAWPLLHDWLAESLADRVILTRLRAAAAEWDRGSRDLSYLYSGSRLESALETVFRASADARQDFLGPTEVAFLRASRLAAARRRTRRWLVAVVGALAVYLGCWGGLATARVLSAETEAGISVVPFSVALAILGAWAVRVPGRSRHREVPRDQAGPTTRTVPDSGAGANDGSDSAGGGGGWPSPDSGAEHGEYETRPRFLTGILPERAPADEWIDLCVQVTLAATSGSSVKMGSFPVSSSGTAVTITVSAPGLIPRGDLEQDLRVPLNADSRQVRFGFIAGRAGLHVVGVRAFLDGTCLGELSLQISVEHGVALEEGRPRAALMTGLAAEPGEVTLQVSRTASGGYSFQLLSEALYPMVLIDRLAGDPAAVVGQMIAELRAISAGQSRFGSAALVRKRLRSLGARLWADVVPEAVREQFWAQRARIGLFTIASDIDTVPWELLYPVDGDNEDGFLVEQFPVVRRVYGQGRARILRLNKGAGFIVPPRSPANAMDEVAAVRAILPPHVIHRGAEAGLAQVHELLEATPSVLHFAGHNSFTDEAGSLISLDGGPLRPDDICYARLKHSLEAVSPLVFFNGCRTAGEIPGFTQMNGWATEFMGAGAAAFIGSLWAVRSSPARIFAEEFYRALVRDRQPLGIASLQARQAIAADESDPTWLAYAVYGNPSASVEANRLPGFRTI